MDVRQSKYKAKTCVECGLGFTPLSGIAKVCSIKCRKSKKNRVSREYSEKNQVKVREWSRRSTSKYIEKNREWLNAKARQEWKDNPRHKDPKYALEWARRNPDKVAAIAHRRRARQASAPGFFSKEDWESIKRNQNFLCYDCNQHKPLTVGHAVPLCRGGSNWPDNIIGQCRSCNSKQGTSVHPDFVMIIGY